MKLSELSRRDYIAIEVVGDIAQLTLKAMAALPGAEFNADTAFPIIAEKAYQLADAMIAYEGKPEWAARYEEMKVDIERLQRSNEILQSMNAEGPDWSARIALEQIWEFLGVNNQTAAMQMLRDAFPELVK